MLLVPVLSPPSPPTWAFLGVGSRRLDAARGRLCNYRRGRTSHLCRWGLLGGNGRKHKPVVTCPWPSSAGGDWRTAAVCVSVDVPSPSPPGPAASSGAGEGEVAPSHPGAAAEARQAFRQSQSWSGEAPGRGAVISERVLRCPLCQPPPPEVFRRSPTFHAVRLSPRLPGRSAGLMGSRCG